MLSIESNVAQVVQQIEAVADSIAHGMEAGERKVGEKIEERLASHIQRIEDSPIPTGPSGSPLWERTGNLKAGVGQATEFFADDDGATVQVGIGGEAASYAAHREGLGSSETPYGWMPQHPADDVVRKNSFFHDTAREIAEESIQIIETELGLAIEAAL